MNEPIGAKKSPEVKPWVRRTCPKGQTLDPLEGAGIAHEGAWWCILSGKA
jgi:hypothetical protein